MDEEERAHGFTLKFNYTGEELTEKKLFTWLNRCFPQNQNILYARLASKKKVIIVYDSTTNVFDVIQNIGSEVQMCCIGKEYAVHYRIIGMEIIMNDTKLCVVELLPSLTSSCFNLTVLRKYLEQFGKVFEISRERKKGICTGIIRTLMALKDESQIPEVKEYGVFKIIPYRSDMFNYWSDETTEKFYDDLLLCWNYTEKDADYSD